MSYMLPETLTLGWVTDFHCTVVGVKTMGSPILWHTVSKLWIYVDYDTTSLFEISPTAFC